MKIVVTGRLPSVFGMTKTEVKRAAEYFAMRSSSRMGDSVVWREVTVCLVGDADSDACHRAIMGVEGATDVITQAYDAMPPEAPGLYGELVVNTDQAVRAAPARKGWSKAKELLLYIAHGMDHLSGADDFSERDYLRMRRRELGWLSALAALFPSR